MSGISQRVSHLGNYFGAIRNFVKMQDELNVILWWPIGIALPRTPIPKNFGTVCKSCSRAYRLRSQP